MQSTRARNFQDLDKTIHVNRIPRKLWSLLLLFYVPIGFVLAIWRLFLSLQLLLLLLVIPEGYSIKRWMLRVYFGVLGIVVTTSGESRDPKIYIANKRSHIDHIVLHLATECTTVSYDKYKPLLSPLFSHHIYSGKTDETIESESKLLPAFDDLKPPTSKYTPYVVQPEWRPTNGLHMLLTFRTWPFALGATIQPVAITVFRPLPIHVTTAKSSGWSDLWWTFFVPFTTFHVRFLSPLDNSSPSESPEQFAKRTNSIMSTELGLKECKVTKRDIDNWFSRLDPPPPPKRIIPTGPIIPPSEFDPAELSASKDSPEIEAMVQQVTAVLPQVPHTAIRKDLKATKSVDRTITNFLEGRTKYTSISNLYATSAASLRKRTARSGADGSSTRPKTQTSSTGGAQASGGGGGGGLFDSRGSATSLSSANQRQLSLEEKKKLLIENARKRYIEKHGPP